MQQAPYKTLLAWQKSDLLAKEIYKSTYPFPKSEQYGITSQLRRAALSVPTNIVEGYGKFSPKELKRFLRISLGSLAETEYLIDFAFDIQLLTSEKHHKLQRLRREAGSLLWKYYLSCK